MTVPTSDPRLHLRADCAACTGLCCVVPAFSRSSDFAIDKPAGTPCPHLQGDHRCGIHHRLRTSGFAGCTVYDCFGAGQRTVRTTAGADADEVATTFRVVRDLHELLWYLADLLGRDLPADQHADVRRLADEVDALAAGPDRTGVDVGAAHGRVDAVLRRASRTLRADLGTTRDLARADLVGADLRGQFLRGADLRGALMLGADLRGADLRCADFVGADLRGADLRGATLVDALFVTQPQVEAARGDTATALPAALRRPGHWDGRPVSSR